MTILLLGGTGRTSKRVANLLTAANKPLLLAARKPEKVPAGLPAVQFEWTDEETWAKAFEQAAVTTVYLIEPQESKPWVPMIKYVDFARARGVRRFVLCAGTSATRGKDGMGRVWDHLVETGVDFCVLRPSWFMENLIEPGPAHTIGQLKSIFTACGDGKIPFVSADNIAEVAFHALTDEKSLNRDVRISGPELLTYDVIAATLTQVLGHPIQHVRLDREARVQGLLKAGLDDYYANFVANLEARAATEGLEAEMNDDVQQLTGHPPKSFATFAEENKKVWSPSA